MPTTPTSNTQTIGRGSSFRGKLVAMPTTNDFMKHPDILKDPSKYSADNYGLSIEFPAHPKTIELARSAEYMVQSNPFLPDGYHQYMSTKPMEIPITFELHSFDRTYCKQGALTLLQIAARLHSFILPITNQDNVYARVISTPSKTGQPAEGQQNLGSATQSVNWDVVGDKGVGIIYPPVTCWLHLIWVDSDSPGISCIGYLREVKAVLNGPFLKGPADSFNLPSSGEFSFTFVHRPGHNNSFGLKTSSQQPTVNGEQNAFARKVRDRLFNTRDLVQAAFYQGINDTIPETATPQPAASPITNNFSLFSAPPPDPSPANLQFAVPITGSRVNAPQPRTNPAVIP